MKPRKNINPKVLKEEKLQLLLFSLQHLEYYPGARTFMKDVYEAYSMWRVSRGHGKPAVNLNGFGRLFDKRLPRTMINVKGRIARGLVGVRLC